MGEARGFDLERFRHLSVSVDHATLKRVNDNGGNSQIKEVFLVTKVKLDIRQVSVVLTPEQPITSQMFRCHLESHPTGAERKSSQAGSKALQATGIS